MVNDIESSNYSNCSNYYVAVNKYGVRYGTSLRFWENKNWINSIDPYGCFSGILDIV